MARLGTEPGRKDEIRGVIGTAKANEPHKLNPKTLNSGPSVTYTARQREANNAEQTNRPEVTAQTTGGGAYSSNPYEAQANALYQQLMSRGPFRYDLQGDMLYRQAADQYTQLGRQAMMDAMGTAAGLTGGYASSNAQLVGTQANQNYLMQLNSMIPDFYDRAYQAWQDQGDDLYNRYQLAMSRVPSRAAAATEETEPVKTETATLGDKIAQMIAGSLPSNSTAATQAAVTPQVSMDLADLWLEYLKKNKE